MGRRHSRCQAQPSPSAVMAPSRGLRTGVPSHLEVSVMQPQQHHRPPGAFLLKMQLKFKYSLLGKLCLFEQGHGGGYVFSSGVNVHDARADRGRDAVSQLWCAAPLHVMMCSGSDGCDSTTVVHLRQSVVAAQLERGSHRCAHTLLQPLRCSRSLSRS